MASDFMSFLLESLTSVRDTVVELKERSDSERVTTTCTCVCVVCLCGSPCTAVCHHVRQKGLVPLDCCCSRTSVCVPCTPKLSSPCDARFARLRTETMRQIDCISNANDGFAALSMLI